MDPYQETFESWDKVAQLYQEKFMDLDLYNDSYDLFCSGLSPGAALLEIGCGPGNITRYLLNRRPDLKIEATDISPQMIELAAQNCPQAQFMVMDARNISELRHQYDAIVCGFCIPYLTEADTAVLINNISRLLVKGGVFYLSFVAGSSSQSGFQAGSSGHRMYFYYHPMETIEEILKKNNLKLIKTTVKEYQRNSNTMEQHSILMAGKN